MAVGVDRLPSGVSAPTAVSTLTLRRAALWALLLSKLIAGWGVQWDIQWHVLVGRDSFWIPPHVMTYAGVTLAVLVSFGILAWETLVGSDARGQRILGLTGTRGFLLAAAGIGLTVLAAPIDDFWHRMFGLDVTLWSPPHLLGIVGAAINSLACFVIASEVYPTGHRARFAAIVTNGAMLYGGLHLTVDPSIRVAYLNGGVLFYTITILSALILPLSLATTAIVSGNRLAPVILLLILIPLGMVGQQIAHRGFEILQPVSVIDAEITKDPTSPIAVAMVMARKEGVTPGQTGGWRHVFALLPALAMALVDARRRPVAATVAYAVTLFAVFAWRLPSRPSLAAVAPNRPETVVALVLTVMAAVVGGFVAGWLAGQLREGGSPSTAVKSSVNVPV